MILFGVVLVAAIVIWTIRLHRKGVIRIPTWLWIVGGLVLTVLLVLLCMNCLPTFGVSATEQSAVPIPE